MTSTAEDRSRTEARRQLQAWQHVSDAVRALAEEASVAAVRVARFPGTYAAACPAHGRPRCLPKTASQSVSVSVMDEWLIHIKTRGCAPRTPHDARQSADKAIFPEWGDTLIAQLTPGDLGEWHRKIKSGEGRASPCMPAASAGAMPSRRPPSSNRSGGDGSAQIRPTGPSPDHGTQRSQGAHCAEVRELLALTTKARRKRSVIEYCL